MVGSTQRTGRIVALVAGIVGVVLVVTAVVVVVLGGGNDDDPADTAADYLAAWQDQDYEAMAALVDEPPDDFADEHASFLERMRASEVSYELGEVEVDGSDSIAWFEASMDLTGLGAWSYEGRLRLRRSGEGDSWQVAWTRAAIHPAQREDLRLRLTAAWPERGAITDEAGEPLVTEQPAQLIGIEPQRMEDVGDRTEIKDALQEHLDVDPALVDQGLDAPGVQPDHLVPVVTVSQQRFDQVRDEIYDIPGLVFRERSMRMGPTDVFARHVIGTTGEITAERLEELGSPYQVGDVVGTTGLEARYEEALAGAPSGEIELIDSADTVVETVDSIAGREPVDVVTTLDPAVQQAVDAALEGVERPAGAVVVDTDGNVRAVASRPLDEGFNRALAGSYPPGSTFKVVTTDGFLSNGVTPNTEVECQETIVAGGREFKNFESSSLGTVPFRTAFAESCNTAFIATVADLPNAELTAAAERFGFNADYSVGLTTVGGEFPEPADSTEKAAAAIGQGRVLASPLHMATVAGAVVDGTWEPPTLLVDPPEVSTGGEDAEGGEGEGETGEGEGDEAEGEGDEAEQPAAEPQELDPEVRETLASLMERVVTEGSGTEAAVLGATVGGKTGTAEFGSGDPLPTHAWFIGFRDDLAVAVVIEDGGVGGRDAAPIAGDILAALP